jgi:hypothetical protein
MENNFKALQTYTLLLWEVKKSVDKKSLQNAAWTRRLKHGFSID